MHPDMIARFAAIVGDQYVITDPAVLAGYLVEPRNLYHGRTPLLLRPGSSREVAAIMALASETRTAIVPQGGNTGLVGGQQPDDSGAQVIVSLSRLNRIRSIHAQGNVALVEAGVTLAALQQAAVEAGRLFPLSLGSEGSCQIGGNLSSNAGGTAVLAYGNARDLCLGLEVVLPDGRILDDLRTVRKDNSGYDLKDLFIGAEGTLGIITAAALKLFARPRGRAVAYAGLDNPAQAVELFTQAQARGGFMLTGFELVSRLALQFSLAFAGAGKGREPLSAAYPWYVLVEVSSACSDAAARAMMEALLADALEQGIVRDAVIAANHAQEQAFWQLREEIAPAQKAQGGSIKHDISVPVAAIADFLARADALVEKMIPGARLVTFGHMGDGNLHYNISQPEGADTQGFLAHWPEINHCIHSLVMDYGGAFSAEHGIGRLKRDDLLAFKSPVAVAMMRGIKQLFDPLNIMNPGKVL